MNTLNPSANKSGYGLENIGIKTNKTVYWNLNSEQLYEEAIKNGEGTITLGGAFSVDTGKYTGRSPNDRFFVETEDVKNTLWWHKGNKGISEAHFENLFSKALKYMEDKDLYVRDAYVGSAQTSRMPIRVINEYAWHNMFARNMFIEPSVA